MVYVVERTSSTVIRNAAKTRENISILILAVLGVPGWPRSKRMRSGFDVGVNGWRFGCPSLMSLVGQRDHAEVVDVSSSNKLVSRHDFPTRHGTTPTRVGSRQATGS